MSRQTSTGADTLRSAVRSATGEEALVAAVPKRHRNRRRFDDPAVPAELAGDGPDSRPTPRRSVHEVLSEL